jgi:hypothetical protein
MKHTVKTIMSMLMLLIVPLYFFSCSDDEPSGPKVLLPKLEGFYVYGTNTVAAEPSEPSARMTLAILDSKKLPEIANKAGVYSKIMYIGANSTISFANVDENEKGTVYGAEDGGSEDNGLEIENVPVDDIVVNGKLEVNGSPIQVTAEGLYYVFVDFNEGDFVLMPVKPAIIGPATANGWASNVPLPLKSLTKEKAVFEASVPLKGANGYRYMLNAGGWHAYQRTDEVTTLTSLGVPDYQVAWDTGINDVNINIPDMPNKESGVYTVTLTFNFLPTAGDWEEVKTKTGDLLVDYSADKYGWFGNAYYAEGTTEGAWDAIHHSKTPVKDGNKYNWVWEMELIEGRSFVLREDKEEGGSWITYGGAAKVGSAFDNEDIIKETGQDNYYVVNGGIYTVTFTINAEDEGRVLTIEPKE